LSETTNIISVNTKKEYHNCEMIFNFLNDDIKSDFEVDQEQQYKIHTTIKEVEKLSEALSVFQKPGFKENFLIYTSVQDGSNEYPNFVMDYITAVELGKELQALANDEDSLVQLSEYCMETPPTYEDDFRINKRIISITIDGQTHDVKDFDDVEDFIDDLKEEKPALFV